MSGWDIATFVGSGVATVLAVWLILVCVDETWRNRHPPHGGRR